MAVPPEDYGGVVTTAEVTTNRSWHARTASFGDVPGSSGLQTVARESSKCPVTVYQCASPGIVNRRIAGSRYHVIDAIDP